MERPLIPTVWPSGYSRLLDLVHQIDEASRFLTLEGLPSDHYLWLTGVGGKLLRGEVKPTEALPPRGK